MIRALIFDFDGLIVDTEGAIYQSWQELYQSYGCDLPMDLWLTGIGTSDWDLDPLAELEARARCNLDRVAIGIQRRMRGAELITRLPLLPGVRIPAGCPAAEPGRPAPAPPVTG
jgi:beta-phosphoglucomutase-like phosphatase (HAD superfamily)